MEHDMLSQRIGHWVQEVNVSDIHSMPGLAAHHAYMQGREYSSHARSFPPFGGVVEDSKLFGRVADSDPLLARFRRKAQGDVIAECVGFFTDKGELR
jgi:hypothetical protein